MVLKVVIVGAGPAGMLMALLLMQQNHDNKKEDNGESSSPSPPLYQVVLVDNRENLGDLPEEKLQRNHRSWMIGLSGHGLAAIREIPHLWENYVQPTTVRISSAIFAVAGFRWERKVDEYMTQQEPYSVDRNFIVAALQRCLKDRYSPDANLTTLYDTKVLYVDAERARLLTRRHPDAAESESYLDYDLLIGADGVRSVVREALVKYHPNFELEVSDTFSEFKSVRVPRPAGVLSPTMGLVSTFCGMRVYGAPMTGNWIGLMFSCSRHRLHTVPLELRSSDPIVVEDFLRRHWTAVPLNDYKDLAEQWVNGPWNRNVQVHCSSYHSTHCKIAIMGDAAHATSPSIAMGMNTALRDAQALARLLHEHHGDLDAVLPAYSRERVKEGNSLTSLAMNVSCRSPPHHVMYVLGLLVRTWTAKWLPWAPVPPEMSVSNPECTLSQVYEQMSRNGSLNRHRARPPLGQQQS